MTKNNKFDNFNVKSTGEGTLFSATVFGIISDVFVLGMPKKQKKKTDSHNKVRSMKARTKISPVQALT